MTKKLERANRVSIVGNDEGYVARFWRTHKEITTVDSTQIGWTPQIEGLNKTAQRELFRVWVCENAEKFGIEYDPVDKRSEDNRFPSKYDSDQLLMDTAVKAISKDVEEWVGKIVKICNRDLGLISIVADEIIPVTERNGREVSSKYMNGNWAYADIPMIVTVLDNDEGIEGYVTMVAHLVSGQLKKPDTTYTVFYDELAVDLPQIVPTKEDKTDKTGEEESKPADIPVEESKVEDKPKSKRGRKSKDTTANADTEDK